MNKIISTFIGLVLVLVAVPLQTANTAQASGEPRIEVQQLSNNRFRIDISNGYRYSQVDLYSHQSDSELWNGILNVGTTDGNGRFSTTRTFNSFHPELDWFWYADVGGYSSPTIKTGYSAGGRVLSNQTYDSGTLVLDNGTVYLIYRDQKIGFANAFVFEQLGFKWSNVVYGNTNSIPQIYTVTNPYSSHPWGSWISLNGTVYFVHENGLIPVTSYDIFLNNGGQQQLIVPMNYYDQQIKYLSNLKKNDSRLN